MNLKTYKVNPQIGEGLLTTDVHGYKKTFSFEESLGSLETLSISNFSLLETICWGGNIQNLKTLSK